MSMAPSETAAAAERYNRKIRKIDGVICVAADAPVTAATVAQRLRLPGLPVHVAELACDKLAMKKCFPLRRRAGALVRRSRARRRNCSASPSSAAAIWSSSRWISAARRGVQRVAQVEDLAKAFMLARSHSPTERVMVEQYLDGPQVSTESIVIGRALLHARLFRPQLRISGTLCALLHREWRRSAQPSAGRRSRPRCATWWRAPPPRMGVTDGTVKGDIVVHKGEPYVIELAARLSGGFFCTREIPLNTGVDFIGAAIKVALGEAGRAGRIAARQHVTPVIQRYAFPEPGTVVAVSWRRGSARRFPASPKWSSPPSRATSFRRPATSGPAPPWCWPPAPAREAALTAANDALALIRIETA